MREAKNMFHDRFNLRIRKKCRLSVTFSGSEGTVQVAEADLHAIFFANPLNFFLLFVCAKFPDCEQKFQCLSGAVFEVTRILFTACRLVVLIKEKIFFWSGTAEPSDGGDYTNGDICLVSRGGNIWCSCH